MNVSAAERRRYIALAVLRAWDEPVDTGCSCHECVVRKELSDPTTLTEHLATALRERGVQLLGQGVLYVDDSLGKWFVFTWAANSRRLQWSLRAETLADVRAAYLRVLELPENATAHDAMDAIGAS